MKTLRPTRRIEWDILESRRCPSLTVPSAAADQPVEHLDPQSVAEHAIDLATVAAGQASNVVFLGDSITQFFQQKSGASVWSSRIAPLGAADLGVAGDTTNNLLWRLENGELAGQPRVAVLLIGTNNLGYLGESVDQTVAGIEADIAAIHSISPQTEILLNGLFPRGLPTDQLRAEVLEVNAQLANLAGSLGVIYSDPGANLVTADGSIAPNVLTDLLHPDASGYEIWADGDVDTIREMLSTTLTTAPVATTTLPLASKTDTNAAVQASAPSIVRATQPPTISPTQGAVSTPLDVPPSVPSTPPPVTPVADPGLNVVPSVSVGHSALQRVAQATPPAQQTSDPSDDHLG